MKTKINLFLMACLVLASCSKLHYGHGDNDDDTTYNEIKVDEGVGSVSERIEISPNEIVVRYDASTSLAERESVRNDIRNEYPAVEIEECDCGDIDLWVFDPTIEELDIEGVVNGLPSRNPAGKVRGDRSLDIFLPEIDRFRPLGQAGGEPGFIAVADPSSINIAIIDTGIDFAREEISSSTRENLYPSGNFSSCLSTQAGWNFLGTGDLNLVNDGNQDIMDQNGHGTYVTKIITDILDVDSINYQILPLKVFDAEGKGSYWDVLCALAYVKDINQNTIGSANGIDIVNASFGGEMPEAFFRADADGNRSLFAEMLDELNELNVLVVTSAGNKGQDNELGPQRDFLSFFDADNLLTVGGYFDDGVRPVTDPVQLDSRSNFGATSIDIALAFNNYELIFDNPVTAPTQDFVTLDGTSYSAAAMSALAAKTIKEARDNGMVLKPAELKNMIFNNAGVTTGDFQNRIIDDKALLRD